jgi:hypothetical protein
MSDLVAFLNARLDEDEATAKASVMPEWMISESGEFGYIVAAVGTETTGESIADAWQEDVAVHIARHDPARVLREVEAKRAMLAELTRWPFDYRPGCNDPIRLFVHLLAAPYSDHPDWRAQWAG